jgi:hypothetical protein
MKTSTLRRYIFLPLVLAPLTILFSCAHEPSEKEKINAELQTQPAVSMGGSVAMESRKMIEENTSITAEQKTKLLDLQARLAGQAAAYRQEVGKLKMLLVKDLMDPSSEPRHVSKIKDRIIDLDRKNVKGMLDGFDEAQKILGRRSYEDERLYRAFLMDRMSIDERH